MGLLEACRPKLTGIRVLQERRRKAVQAKDEKSNQVLLQPARNRQPPVRESKRRKEFFDQETTPADGRK